MRNYQAVIEINLGIEAKRKKSCTFHLLAGSLSTEIRRLSNSSFLSSSVTTLSDFVVFDDKLTTLPFNQGPRNEVSL